MKTIYSYALCALLLPMLSLRAMDKIADDLALIQLSLNIKALYKQELQDSNLDESRIKQLKDELQMLDNLFYIKVLPANHEKVHASRQEKKERKNYCVIQ